MTMTPAEYRLFAKHHRRLLQQLRMDLDFFLEDVGPVPIFAVETRVKTYESASAKARLLNVSIEELYDIAGLRIVVGTEREVAVVKRFFEMKQIVKDLTVARDWKVTHKNGYRSTHLILDCPGHYTRGVHATQVEVQLPTILEHAFNFLSHTWVYKKTGRADPQWTKKFQNIASRLREIDERVGELQEALVSGEAVTPGATLTPFSYQTAVRDIFGETVSVTDAVDFVRSLVHRGASTNAELISFFKRDDIRQAWETFTALAQQGSAFAASYADSRFRFWQIIGLHMSGLEKFLEIAQREIAELSKEVESKSDDG